MALASSTCRRRVRTELHGNERTMNRRLQFDGELEGAQRANLGRDRRAYSRDLDAETGCNHHDDVRVDCAALPHGPSDADFEMKSACRNLTPISAKNGVS